MKRKPSNLGANFSVDEDEDLSSRPLLSTVPSYKNTNSHNKFKYNSSKLKKIEEISDLGFREEKLKNMYLMIGVICRRRKGDGGGGSGGDGGGEEAGFLHCGGFEKNKRRLENLLNL